MEGNRFSLYNEKNIIVDEAYSFIRANIYFSSKANGSTSLCVLSSVAGEGKTTVAINLAIKFAQNGSKVLLVDADLRKPYQQKRLSGQIKTGLTDAVLELLPLTEVAVQTNIDNLYFLSSGSKSSSPAGLFTSAAFQALHNKSKENYDLVIFDTPPLLSVIDGAIIASKTDATVLVVKAGGVSLPKLKRVKEQVETAKANVLGVILNNVESTDYKSYFSSYDYGTHNKNTSKKALASKH